MIDHINAITGYDRPPTVTPAAPATRPASSPPPTVRPPN